MAAGTLARNEALERLMEICDLEDLVKGLEDLSIDALLTEEEADALVDLLASGELAATDPSIEDAATADHHHRDPQDSCNSEELPSAALRRLDAEVPTWRQRLRLLLLRQALPRRMQDLSWAMSKLQSACSAARRSFLLRDLVQVVLTMPAGPVQAVEAFEALEACSASVVAVNGNGEGEQEETSSDDEDVDDVDDDDDDDATPREGIVAEEDLRREPLLPRAVSVPVTLPATTPRSTRSLEVRTLVKLRDQPTPPGPFVGYTLLHRCIEQLEKDRPHLTPEVVQKELGALRLSLDFDLRQCRQDWSRLQREVMFLRGEAKRERSCQLVNLARDSLGVGVAVFDIDDHHDAGLADAAADPSGAANDQAKLEEQARTGASARKATSFLIPPLALSAIRPGADTASSTQDTAGGPLSELNSAEGSSQEAPESGSTDLAVRDIRPPTARLPASQLSSSGLTKWVAFGLDAASFYQDWKVGVAVLGEGVHRSVLEVPSSSDPPPPGMLARLGWLGEWRQCWCEVRATLLVIYTMDESGRLILGTQYVPLPGAEVLPFESVAASPRSRTLALDYPNGFEIQVAAECDPSQRIERFCSGTPRELAKWLSFLQHMATAHKGGYLQYRRPGWWFVRNPWQRLYCVFETLPNVEAPCLKGFNTLRDCAEGRTPEQVWLLGSASIRSFGGEGASKWAQSLKRQLPFGIEIEDYDTGRCLHFACCSEADQDAWLGVLCEDNEDVVSPALSQPQAAVDVERMSLDPGVDPAQLFDLYSEDEGEHNHDVAGKVLTARSNRSSRMDSARSSRMNTHRSQGSPFTSPRLHRRHSDTGTPPLSPHFERDCPLVRRSSVHLPLRTSDMDSERVLLEEVPVKALCSWDGASGATLSEHPLSSPRKPPVPLLPKSGHAAASAGDVLSAAAPLQRVQLQHLELLQMERSYSFESVDEEAEWCGAAANGGERTPTWMQSKIPSGQFHGRLSFKLNFQDLLRDGEADGACPLQEANDEEDDEDDDDEELMSPRGPQEKSYAEILVNTAEEMEASFRTISRNLLTTEADAKSLLHFFGWDLDKGAAATIDASADDSSLASDLHALLTYLSNFTDEVDVAWRQLLHHRAEVLLEEDASSEKSTAEARSAGRRQAPA